MTKPERRPKSAYPYTLSIPTRWMDNDVYGHVNNVVYYSYFDTVVNRYLIEAGALNIEQSDTIGLVVETGCSYFAPLAFPDAVTAGLAARRIGNSSVEYAVGLFRDEETEPAAQGRFVHVYVDRETRRPKPLSPEMRAAVEKIEAAS